MPFPDIQGSKGPPEGEFMEALRNAKSIGCSVWFIEGSKNFMKAKMMNTDRKITSEASTFFHTGDFIVFSDEIWDLLKISVPMNTATMQNKVNWLGFASPHIQSSQDMKAITIIDKGLQNENPRSAKFG